MPKWKLKTEPDSKEYFTVFSTAINQSFITKTGGLTESGYGLYLSLLGVIGKNSAYNSKPRKTNLIIYDIKKLKMLELVFYDPINYNYGLTDKGNVMLQILARCLEKRGIPKI